MVRACALPGPLGILLSHCQWNAVIQGGSSSGYSPSPGQLLASEWEQGLQQPLP